MSVGLMAVAAALAYLAWRALNPPPPLEITERGILDRRLAVGWLDWDSIEGAYRPRVPDGDRVLLRVRLDEGLRRRIGRRLRALDPRPECLELSLDLAGTPYSEVDVLQEIVAHSPAAAQAAPEGLDSVPCR